MTDTSQWRFQTDIFGEPPIVERLVTDLSGESAIDEALRDGDLSAAEELTNELALSAYDYLAEGLYPENFGRIVMRRVALPLLYREFADQLGDADVDQLAINEVHAEGLPLLDDMSRLYESTTRVLPFMSPEAGMIRGDLSELTVFSMTTQLIRGTEADAFNITLSSKEENRNTIGSERGNNGFDFWVRQRRLGKSVKLQVKSSAKRSRLYAPDILVINIDDLTGSTSPSTPQATRFTRRQQLRQALISGDSGEAAPADTRLLSTATQRMLSHYYSRLGDTAFNRMIK